MITFSGNTDNCHYYILFYFQVILAAISIYSKFRHQASHGQHDTSTVKTGFSALDDLDSSAVLKCTQRPIILYCSIY
jgi:hypothetical protein